VAGSGLEAALRMLDRKIRYFEPDAMATVLYGLYTPGTTAILDEQIAAGTDSAGPTAPTAEDACAAVMRALAGNAPARDDIAVLMLSRACAHSSGPAALGGRRPEAASPGTG